LCTERVARWRQAHARPVNERANHAQQIKRLEREISHLVGLVAKGQALPDIAKAIVFLDKLGVDIIPLVHADAAGREQRGDDPVGSCYVH